jgi:hypothetical protein
MPPPSYNHKHLFISVSPQGRNPLFDPQITPPPPLAWMASPQTLHLDAATDCLQRPTLVWPASPPPCGPRDLEIRSAPCAVVWTASPPTLWAWKPPPTSSSMRRLPRSDPRWPGQRLPNLAVLDATAALESGWLPPCSLFLSTIVLSCSFPFLPPSLFALSLHDYFASMQAKCL